MMALESKTRVSLSGRHVSHSRNGCVGCKERRRRCSEERPACQRCVKEGLECTYFWKLHWEDESAGRGIKHGRRILPGTRFVDPTPPSNVVEAADWEELRGCEYFVNTDASDIEANPVQPLLTRYSRIRRLPQCSNPQYALKTRNIGSSDGSLLQYYQSEVCHELTLVDDASNGFRHIVLPMSEIYPSVMESVLAVGAIYLSLDQLETPSDYYAIALHHKQRALTCLRNELSTATEVSSGHLLVSILMMCLLDITDNCQTSWATHLSAAANLIRNGNLPSREPSLVSFISKFFATRDIMGRSACGKKAKFKETEWQNPQEIDKSVGCSYELMRIISSITDVSRQLSNSNNSGDPDLMKSQLLIETQLDTIIQTVPLSVGPSTTEAQTLTQTSTLTHIAAKIYFYTALHSAIPSTHLVRSLVSEQIDLIDNMPTLRSAHLWSIFVTGLYAEDDTQRIFFLKQFERLKSGSTSSGSAQAAKTIVETVWKRRDLEADLSQPIGSRMSDWDKIVRPMSEGLNLV